MKTYDRAQVLQVAAQLLAARAYDHGGQLDHDPAECSVRAALRLIDEVERQCPPPGKPETADPYNHLLRVAEMLADCEQPTDDDTYNAWEHALAYFKQSMPSEVAEVVELARAYYAKPGNSCGGPLHIVLDDYNLEDQHIAFCRAEAERGGDADGVAICDKMARWPVRWRRVVAEATS